MAIQTGQQLLHYRLIEKIGEGGMGEVWKAIALTPHRPAWGMMADFYDHYYHGRDEEAPAAAQRMDISTGGRS